MSFIGQMHVSEILPCFKPGPLIRQDPLVRSDRLCNARPKPYKFRCQLPRDKLGFLALPKPKKWDLNSKPFHKAYEYKTYPLSEDTEDTEKPLFCIKPLFEYIEKPFNKTYEFKSLFEEKPFNKIYEFKSLFEKKPFNKTYEFKSLFEDTEHKETLRLASINPLKGLYGTY